MFLETPTNSPSWRSFSSTVLFPGFCAALQQPHRLETQLILKRNPGVKPRSQFEFVVTAPPTPKQQFTDHTGQTNPSTTQSQSSSEGLLHQKHPQTGCSMLEMTSEKNIYIIRTFLLARPARIWFPLEPSDKHTDDDRCLTKTIKALWRRNRCLKKRLTSGSEAEIRLEENSFAHLSLI